MNHFLRDLVVTCRVLSRSASASFKDIFKFKIIVVIFSCFNRFTYHLALSNLFPAQITSVQLEYQEKILTTT